MKAVHRARSNREDGMSEKSNATVVTSRRDMLKLVGAAAPAAAAVAVTTGTAQADEAKPTSLGMKKTEHVKKYLETARF